MGINIGLLILRVGIGFILVFGHGMHKLFSIGTEAAKHSPDPLGIGSELTNFLGATVEVGFGSLIAFGLFTRLLTIPIISMLLVAVLVFHAEHPFFHQMLVGLSPEHPLAMTLSKEFAMCFMLSYTTLFFTGPGKYSIDYLYRIDEKFKKYLHL